MIKNILTTATIIFITLYGISQDSECSKFKSRYILNKKSETVNLGELDYDVKYVKLDLKLTNKNQYITGNVLTKAKVASTVTDKWVFELHSNFNIDSIKMAGKKLSYSRNGNYITATLDKNYSQNSYFEGTIYYNGFSPNGGFFNGYSSAASGTWGTRASWSLSEPFNAHHWWPSKQVLTDLIDSSDVWITCDTSQIAGSNGTLQQITKLDTLHRFEWKNRTSIAYYLISVAVSNYIDYSFTVIIPGISKPVLIQNYIYNNPKTLENFKAEIDKTADIIKFFSEKYGIYPFWKDKYGHCMAPFSGGMEHQTMTTLGLFNTNLTAHELAHQWFGDNVTCKSWRDIWINEGFARYSEVLYSEKTNPGYARSQMDEYHNSVLTDSSGSVYVDDTTNALRIFSSRLTYNKGAAVIHTLRYEIMNDTVFFDIIKKFQIIFSLKNASIADFRDLLEKETGKNWHYFFNQWLYGEGYPTYNIHYRTYDKGNLILVKQKTSKPSSVKIFKGNIDLKIKFKSKDTLIRVKIVSDSQLFVINNLDSIISIEVDPNQWVLNDTGYIMFDSTIKAPANVGFGKIINKTNHKIYPNPCDDYFIVTDFKNESKWEIYSISGKILLNGNCEGRCKIDTSLLPEGMYYIKINSSNYPLCIIRE